MRIKRTAIELLFVDDISHLFKKGLEAKGIHVRNILEFVLQSQKLPTPIVVSTADRIANGKPVLSPDPHLDCLLAAAGARKMDKGRLQGGAGIGRETKCRDEASVSHRVEEA